jgi:hypothetical protein
MSAKPRHKKQPIHKPLWIWLKSHKLKIASIGTLTGLYTGYVNYEAASLRSDIYQPLYREVNVMAGVIPANSLEMKYSTESYDKITKDGDILRIPKSLRTKIVNLYKLSSEEHSHIPMMLRLIAYLMPQEITKLRTEADDNTWAEKTVAKLNSELKTPAEVYGFAFSMHHAGIGPAINTADLSHMSISFPGSITWQINDWLKFPQSASDVTGFWTNDSSLRFDDHDEHWYYRITLEDLANHRIGFEQFLRPVYQRLSSESEFQALRRQNNEVTALLEEVQAELTDRVVHPKHLMDLVEF